MRLNPYSTGIRIEGQRRARRQFAQGVLILILLEYE